MDADARRVRVERERAALFRGLPVPVAHVSDVAAAGDYLTCDVAGAPVLLARARDGRVRAFVNMCRHRGAPLTEQRVGTGCSALVCPHHGWVYQLDGGLAHVPGEGFYPNLDKSQLGLLPVPMASAYGFVWALPASVGLPEQHRFERAFDERALRRGLGPIADDLEHLNLAGLSLLHRREGVVPVAWKRVIEGYFAGRGARHRDERAPACAQVFGDHMRAVCARANLATMAARARAEWDIRACATVRYLIFPNTVVRVERDTITVLTAAPLGAARAAYWHYVLGPESARGDTGADVDTPADIAADIPGNADGADIPVASESSIGAFRATIARHLER